MHRALPCRDPSCKTPGDPCLSHNPSADHKAGAARPEGQGSPTVCLAAAALKEADTSLMCSVPRAPASEALWEHRAPSSALSFGAKFRVWVGDQVWLLQRSVGVDRSPHLDS